MKKFHFTGALEVFSESKIYGGHIIIPEHISSVIKRSKNLRLIADFNGKSSICCALLSDGKGSHYILVNKSIQKKLGLLPKQKLEISLTPDTSKYGMFMPEELSSLLDLDPEGSDLFHRLTPGKQRALIHLVAKNKRIETKINKSLTILRYLKDASGYLDFKELNQAFKNANNTL